MDGTGRRSAGQRLFLDDLHVGQRFESGTHTLDAAEIVGFAAAFDPQPFHLDDAAAQGTLFGGLAASGWHTAAITMRLNVESGLPFSGGIVGAGAEITWPKPTRPGDVLRVRSEVTEIRPSRSRPDRGMVTVRSETLNQRDEVLQILVAKLVVPFKGALDMIARRLALSLALGCSVAACSLVGPDYQAPTASLQPFHSAEAVTARPAAPAPALDSWWTGFNDPVLTRIVQRTLDQNLDLAASLARVDQSRAAAQAAGARLLPTGDLQTGISPLHQSTEGPLGTVARHLPGYDRDQSVYDVGVGASWEIDLFGGLHRGVEAAGAEADAAEADNLGVRISVVAEAADAYFQIRGDQARLKLAEDQVATDAHLLDLVRLRQSRGAATDRETAQALALLSQARATVPPLRTALEAQKNRLDVLMAVQPGTGTIDLTADAPVPAVPGVTSGRDASDLLRRRPDVIAAERRLAAANARIGAAISDYYPKISLSGLLGFESLSAGHLFTGGAFQPQATAGLRWRLFDFGKVDAEVAGARGANAEALAHYRKSVLHAAEDVENSFTALVQLEAQNRELTQEIDALTKARDTSEEAYQGGAIGLTDVLDADRQLLLAQDDQARTRADTARAAVSSYRALGGGW